MITDELKKFIEERQEKGVSIDERIEWNEKIAEYIDGIEELREALNQLPEEEPPVGEQDSRAAFVDQLIEAANAPLFKRDFSTELSMDGIFIDGDPIIAEPIKDQGLRLAGDIKAIIGASSAPDAGKYRLTAEVSAVEGSWDKGDEFQIYIGNSMLPPSAFTGVTPKVGTHVIDFEVKQGQDMGALIRVSNNETGGGSGGPAEFVTIKSVTIEKA